MLGATPPRRISRSSTRKETEILESCSTTRESSKRPPNVIRWSEAIEPQISRDTSGETTDRYCWGYPSVAVSVAGMTSAAASPARRARTSYDEIEAPAAMREDCAAVGRALRLERIRAAAAKGAPSLEYDDYPREMPKREIRVDEAAARLANALYVD